VKVEWHSTKEAIFQLPFSISHFSLMEMFRVISCNFVDRLGAKQKQIDG